MASTNIEANALAQEAIATNAPPKSGTLTYEDFLKGRLVHKPLKKKIKEDNAPASPLTIVGRIAGTVPSSSIKVKKN